jgi:phage-related protein
MQIQFFNQGIEEFIAGLDKSTLAKTLRTLDLLEKFGNNLGMPHSKKIGDSLFELRVRGKKELRVLYTFRKGRIIILLHAFIKKTQRIEGKHLALAKERLKSLDHL